MENPKNFDAKCQEIYSRVVTEYSSSSQSSSQICFISYCWYNSKKAMAKSSNQNKMSGIGKIDPRDLKDKLEKMGIKCWMDVEQVGQTGLYQDIAKGLRKAKVMICCISDEYVVSKNCIMEFRFATLSLHLPVILVAVGNGLNWMKSEIGMIGLDFPKFIIQSLDEDMKDIIEIVRSYFESNDKKKELELVSEEMKRDQFSELLELTQRKFINYISSISKAKHFPKLLIMDLMKKDLKSPCEGLCFFFLCENDEVKRNVLQFFFI